MENDLLRNIDKIHTTALGIVRIKRNLELTIDDAEVVTWCKNKIKTASNITRQGKNWYVTAINNTNSITVTINAHSYTIITAHKS
jgi:hypothetical protein